MSAVMITTTALTVTVVCSRASLFTMTFTMAPISLGLATLGQHDVVLPHSWSWVTQWGALLVLALCHSSNYIRPKCLLSCMPIMPGVFRWGDLVLVKVFTFCFQVTMWLPCSSAVAQLLGFVMPQSYGVYPWQAYVHLADGQWPTPGVYWVTASSTASWRWSFMLLIQLSPSHSIYMVGHTAFGAWQESPNPTTLHTWWGGIFFSRLHSTQRHRQPGIYVGH